MISRTHCSFLPIQLFRINLRAQSLFALVNHIVKASLFAFADRWDFDVFPIYDFTLGAMEPALLCVFVAGDSELRLLWNYAIE
jgi:hypothetical protein